MILTLCIDKQPKTNPSNELKTYEINIGNRLCSYDDVYDELIITLNDVNQLEGIIKRRCNIDRFDIITKLQEEYIQTLEIPEITLFEGTNYVYLQDFDYLNMKIEYLTNVAMNKHFAKTEEFNSKLVLTAQEFNLKLSKKLDGEEFTHASIVAKINDDTSEVQIEADKINMKGKEFNLTADNMTIESENFGVSEEGRIRATSGEIGGFNLESDKFDSMSSKTFNYTQEDLTRIQQIILGNIIATDEDYEKYDLNNNHLIDGQDSLRISKIVNGRLSPTQVCKYIINSQDPVRCISIKDENESNDIAVFGMFGGYVRDLSALQITATNNLSLKPTNSSGSTISMFAEDGSIRCVNLTQTSKEEYKKNFEKLDNALDIIKNIDIYKYNMKTDKDTDKKHIGFIIGDKFNYSKEVTSKNNDGVDIYALASVCCKAIQEQQKIIEQLQQKIKRLESDK
ncbi:MAG: tail fiber domain-containing protein [Bacilli bacterium]|nr:tail fiber domain-containing protein [Bacilli bacterium]